MTHLHLFSASIPLHLNHERPHETTRMSSLQEIHGTAHIPLREGPQHMFRLQTDTSGMYNLPVPIHRLQERRPGESSSQHALSLYLQRPRLL
jgi:hypothetical protein